MDKEQSVKSIHTEKMSLGDDATSNLSSPKNPTTDRESTQDSNLVKEKSSRNSQNNNDNQQEIDANKIIGRDEALFTGVAENVYDINVVLNSSEISAIPFNLRSRVYPIASSLKPWEEVLHALNPFELDPERVKKIIKLDSEYMRLNLKEKTHQILSEDEIKRKAELKEELDEMLEYLQSWRGSPAKKAVVRFIGTGLLGAFLYGYANKIGGNLYGQYKYDYAEGKVNWDSFGKALEGQSEIGTKIIHSMAYVFDSTIGRLVYNIPGGKDWVIFRDNILSHDGKGFNNYKPYEGGSWIVKQFATIDRDTSYSYIHRVARNQETGNINFSYCDRKDVPRLKYGRSASAEWISVTLDFSFMTAGYQFIEILADLIDPHIKQPFWDKDNKFNFEKFGWWGLETAKKFAIKNSADWVAGIPYIFITKSYGLLLDKLFPGFYMDTAANFNGSSVKINEDGKIIGTYALPGAMEFWLRFDSYNQLTHRYGKFMDYAFNSSGLVDDFNQWREDGMQIKPAKWAGDALKYNLRETVKVSMYMFPAVLTYVSSRVPQRRNRSAVLMEKEGLIYPVFYYDDPANPGKSNVYLEQAKHFYLNTKAAGWEKAISRKVPYDESTGKYGRWLSPFRVFESAIHAWENNPTLLNSLMLVPEVVWIVGGQLTNVLRKNLSDIYSHEKVRGNVPFIKTGVDKFSWESFWDEYVHNKEYSSGNLNKEEFLTKAKQYQKGFREYNQGAVSFYHHLSSKELELGELKDALLDGAKKYDESYKRDDGFRRTAARHASDQVEAAISYTSYLYVKDAFTSRLDTPEWEKRFDDALKPAYDVIDWVFGQKQAKPDDAIDDIDFQVNEGVAAASDGNTAQKDAGDYQNQPEENQLIQPQAHPQPKQSAQSPPSEEPLPELNHKNANSKNQHEAVQNQDDQQPAHPKQSVINNDAANIATNKKTSPSDKFAERFKKNAQELEAKGLRNPAKRMSDISPENIKQSFKRKLDLEQTGSYIDLTEKQRLEAAEQQTSRVVP